MDQLVIDRENISLVSSTLISSPNFVLNNSSDEDEYDMNHDIFIELDLRSSHVLATTGSDDQLELDYFRISFSALAADDNQDHDHANAELTVTPTCNNINDSASPHDQSNLNDMVNMTSWKPVRSRKASSSAAKIRSSSATAGNGGIMKLLVKMRCIISGLGSDSMGATSLIQRPCCRATSSCTAADHTYNSRIYRNINAFMRMMKPFDKWFTRPRNLHQLITAMRLPSSTKLELVLDHDQMNKLDATRRTDLFGSCGVMSLHKRTKTGSRSSRGRLNKSSSAVHQSGDLSLLHAAIAHCKKSFRGQIEADHFSFLI